MSSGGNLKKLVLNSKGIRAVLKSNSVDEQIGQIANRAVGLAGSGYKAQKIYTSQRVMYSVSADTAEAWKDNSDNNTLLKVRGSL